MEAFSVELFAPALWVIKVLAPKEGSLLPLGMAVGQALAYSTLLGWCPRNWRWLAPLVVVGHVVLAHMFLFPMHR